MIFTSRTTVAFGDDLTPDARRTPQDAAEAR
jgi:hypothetical protein